MKKFLATCLVLVGLIFTPLVAPEAYDKLPGSFKEFADDQVVVDLEGAIGEIHVFGFAEGLYPNDGKGKKALRGTGIFAQSGSAFHIGDGYFVTNAHVINPEVVQIQLTKNVFYVVPVDYVKSRIISLGNNSLIGYIDAELVWEDREKDLAIVKVNKTWPLPYSLNYDVAFTYTAFEYGWKYLYVDELDAGTVVAVIVQQRIDPENGDLRKSPWYEVRYGKVVAPHAVLPEGLDDTMLPWFSLNDVTSDILIYPGDSGSPVFAFKNGRPIFVGVARAVARSVSVDEKGNLVLQWYSYFTRIDPIARKNLERQDKEENQ